MLRIRGLDQPVRHALKWDAISAGVGGVSAGALMPFLAVIARRDLDAPSHLIALLGASFSVGNFFAPLVAHWLRARPKLPYVIGIQTLSRSFFLLMPLAITAPRFVVICLFASAIGSLSAPAYAAVIRDAYPVERRGMLMGLVRVLFVGGAMVGASVGGIVLARVSYRWFFPALAVVGMVGVAAFARVGVAALPGAAPGQRARVWDAFRVLATDPLFRLYSAGFFLWGLGNLLMNPVIPIFQVDVLDISNQWVGYLATMTSAMSMVGFLYWGRMLDKRGPFELLLRMLLVASVMPVTYYFAQGVPVLLVAAAAQGLAMAGGELGYVNAAMRFGERDMAASYAAMFAFLQAIRGIPGPFIGAALSDALGPRVVFLIALGLWAISAGMLYRGRSMRTAAVEEA